MPTVEERVERLKAFKEEETQQDREKEERRLSCLKVLSKRACDLLCLCYECVSNNIGVHQFGYSLREPYSCGFIFMGRWKLVITLEEKEPSLLSWYRDKHVAVYTPPESLRDVSIFTKERWKRKDIFIEGFCEEDLRVLDEKFSKFEKDFYTWFDEKFEVKEEKERMNTIEAAQEYQRTEARYRELSEEDKKFEQLTKEFLDQTNARKDLAEFLQKHRLHIRSLEGGLEIVQATFSGEHRVIYSTSKPDVYPANLVSGDLDAE